MQKQTKMNSLGIAVTLVSITLQRNPSVTNKADLEQISTFKIMLVCTSIPNDWFAVSSNA